MTFSNPDYYKILGVAIDATQSEIKSMYHKLARKYHMDANSEDPTLKRWSHEMMVQLNEANSVLKDPIKRKEYDQYLNTKQSENSRAHQHPEFVYVQSLEQGKAILLEGVDFYPFNAPTPELNADCIVETKKIISKKPHHYLRLEFPNEVPHHYLATIIESAAIEAMDIIEERMVRRHVLALYIIVNAVIGIIISIKFSNSFFDGIIGLLWYMFFTILYYMVLTWVVRFIARGLKSNLVGLRGFVVNGIVALGLTILLVSEIF